MYKILILLSKLIILAFLLALVTLSRCECKKSTSPDYIPFFTSFGSYGEGDSNFKHPKGIDKGPATLVIADWGNDRIVRYDPVARAFQAKWGFSGTGDGEFMGPTDVAMYFEGMQLKYVYVVDQGNNRIQKFDGAGSFLAKWGTLGSGDGEFNNPVSIAVDDKGDVYVTDYGNNRIQKFDNNGNFLLKWGSQGTGTGQFNGPYGIATEGDENYNPKYIYVTDQGNHRVQAFTKSGEFVRAFGSYGSGPGQLRSPSGITVLDGESHVADTGNWRYVIFSIDGKFLGKGGSKGKGSGQFMKPVGISTDGLPLFISDEEQHKISVFRWKT
jgi:tripartite motif-containing protein 71